jgi:hypothetical protein
VPPNLPDSPGEPSGMRLENIEGGAPGGNGRAIGLHPQNMDKQLRNILNKTIQIGFKYEKIKKSAQR